MNPCVLVPSWQNHGFSSRLLEPGEPRFLYLISSANFFHVSVKSSEIILTLASTGMKFVSPLQLFLPLPDIPQLCASFLAYLSRRLICLWHEYFTRGLSFYINYHFLFVHSWNSCSNSCGNGPSARTRSELNPVRAFRPRPFRRNPHTSFFARADMGFGSFIARTIIWAAI